MGVRSRSKRKRRRQASAEGADLISGLGDGGADTMGVRSRSKRKRRRRSSAGGADLISGLGDDVLVRILELLPDAGDAVRTGALSRRWRGLWTRVGSLTFDPSSRGRGLRSANSDERFLDFVQNALAQRAKTDAALDLEHLAISFAIKSPAHDPFMVSRADSQARKLLALRSADAAHEWICYAMERKVKSFVLKLRLFSTWESIPAVRSAGAKNLVAKYRLEQSTINLKDLPSSAKLETMHWDLKNVWVQLPDAAVFASLVDLTLENISPLGVGSVHLLARLVSSACCPSLQKLKLRNLELLLQNELLIEASALLELTISNASLMSSPATLKLKTPSLRIFRLENCDHHGRRVEISAPKLEELVFLPRQPDHIEVDGELPCVESLKVIDLYTHRDENNLQDVNDTSVCLLSRCTSLTCLEVSLKVTMGEGSVDNITGSIPHLPHLISLTVHVYSRKLHSFGAGLAEILKQCSHLKYLHVHCVHEAGDDNQEVEFTGLARIECESWFMKRVLKHAIHLQKVALSFDPRLRLYNMIADSMFVPCGGGTWICHDAGLSYEWNPGTIHK